ncbi:hypothetical protein JHK87_049589 [Glycine soja]|nr:hypothetical protein JHK87_049589 [Glycine soja]
MEFEILKKLSKLEHHRISWGVFDRSDIEASSSLGETFQDEREEVSRELPSSPQLEDLEMFLERNVYSNKSHESSAYIVEAPGDGRKTSEFE